MPRTVLPVLLLVALVALGAPPLVASDKGSVDPIRTAMEDGKFADARRMLENDNQGRGEAERLELLTEVCNAQNDYADGIRYGKKAVAQSPDSSNAHYQYAVAMRNKMRSVSWVKAMFTLGEYKKSLRKSLELNVDNVDALEEQVRFFIEAPGVAGGDAKRARELIPNLKSLDKTRGLAAEILLENKLGEPARAAELLSDALDEDPDNLELRNLYAVQLQKQKRYRDADAEFLTIAAAEGDARLALLALYQRGRTRVLGGFEQQEAVELLEQYIEEATEEFPQLPSRSNAYWRIGNAHEQLAQEAKARTAYVKALELNPKNAQAKKSLKALPR